MTVTAINERVWRASYYLTRRCDLDCWYCCVPGVDAVRRDELDAAGVDAVVANLALMGADLIVFTGGEPFLRPDLLLPALQAARRHGIYPVLLTNGRIAVSQPEGRAKLRELVQAVGTSREDALRLVEYVYTRPVGELRQEIGGVMVTLAALAECPFGLSVSMDSVAGAVRTPQPKDEGSDQKSYYGLAALAQGSLLGLTDLTATCMLDDADPERVLDAVRLVANSGYGVLINLVQRAEPMVGNTTFRAAHVEPHPSLSRVARLLSANRERWNIKNTPEFLANIVDGSYSTWACTEPGLIVVQPDGQVHLCNIVRGQRLPSLNLAQPQAADLATHYGEMWRDDLSTSCPGCYLSCHVDFQYRHKGAIQ